MRPLLRVLALTACFLAPFNQAFAQEIPVLLRDSFPIGSNDGILCQVQDRSIENPAKQSIFDRSWAVVCRDSARPVSNIYAFRKPIANAEAAISPHRDEALSCSGEVGSAANAVPGTTARRCTVADTQLRYSIFNAEKSNMVFVAEGYTAYDSATLLALKSVFNNELASGTIDVATTSIADPAAFARVQALTLKPDQALAEGYRRNLTGEYAEAAEYFETLQQRLSGDAESGINPGEYLINRALQKSNLGEFAEADRLFEEAAPLIVNDAVAGRLARNYEAIHLINQGFYGEAIARLDQPVLEIIRDSGALSQRLEISTPIATRLNGSGRTGNLLGFVDELRLSDQERAEIIDAQALQLRGTALRITGDDPAARTALLDGYGRALSVRDGRVTSITRLRTQILGELALIAERQYKPDDAEQYLRNGLDILATQYPETRAVNGAKAKLAGLLLRQNKEDEALSLYREVIASAIQQRGAATGFNNQLAPFFRQIAGNVATDPALAEDFFQASQLLVRPGVAETQAILARELSAGSDEAARLFRQSTDLSRNVERLRIRFAALGKAEQTAAVQQRREELANQISALEADQQKTQVLLNNYPQYRAVAKSGLSLAEFRESLRNDEAYMRLLTVGRELFLFYASPTEAMAYRLDIDEEELNRQVDTVRASISIFEEGQNVTYPYDIENGRKLFVALFSPIADKFASGRHIIFEPDGAMLRLPINLLVTDDVSVQTYRNRTSVADSDPFDFTGVNWLGKQVDVSTAVSAQAFVDARKATPSTASKAYLGMGQNEPIGDRIRQPAIQATLAGGGNACGWTAAEWNRPIDDAELVSASQLIGGNQSALLTKAEFTDQNLLQKQDLDDYRILHFATHGLVTPPNPRCPARPALLTSFGDEKSDGLLSFQEIFDLNLDADIVILSACDTAGKASITATREAGVGSGGGTALDGLVRSFIGAGGRSVLASHWPAPDEFQATEKLINGFFQQGRDQSIGTALRQSQLELMQNPATSHPFYWAGFAIVGDGARNLLNATGQQAQANELEIGTAAN